MTQWFVKELSKVTGISVQTLHHYDRINLLKPSIRLANGYRVYSERDLLKLQQILALKFFGFELKRIKSLLVENRTLEQLSVQAKILEEKGKALLEASKTLKQIIATVDHDSIDWKTIIKLMEVYRMTQQIEDSWVKEIFTPDELKQYVKFRTELETNATQTAKEKFEKDWADLVAEMKKHLKHDPKSQIGIELGKKCMNMINDLYGKENLNLRTKIWEKGFGEGKGIDEVGLTPELVQWLDKAIDAYWRDRFHSIFAQIGVKSDAEILGLWHEMLDDMYGNDELRKKEIYQIALNDAEVSEKTKRWFRKNFNL